MLIYYVYMYRPTFGKAEWVHHRSICDVGVLYESTLIVHSFSGVVKIWLVVVTGQILIGNFSSWQNHVIVLLLHTYIHTTQRKLINRDALFCLFSSYLHGLIEF